MTALFGYQTALLLRSQRWLPPVLLYGIFLVVGIQSGQPVLDSLGYAAAALLPVTAWLVRVCANQEPLAARSITAAATSPPRVHLASLLAAVACAGAVGAAGTMFVALISRAKSADGQVEIPLLPAIAAGLIAAAVCLLTGAAVGALCTRPLLHGRGWSMSVTALCALLALVTSGSPAKYAVTGLVTGSRTGSVQPAVLPLVAAVLIAGAATAAVCTLSSFRTADGAS
ncbi:ABC transporter [Streptomyces sp. NBC_01142]|uniref:ABC transporter n=1 Tax=Streptomyces sp. NBC_01142 TaxID=2975865 RepID=UPI00225973FA|nr:ABC transporter [Streptomyces sp. NBC_01142]MCX4820010.1 ABC transporter [Streptomyces sp. NBC_01142]